jgi:hypothetical protein
MEEAPGEVTQVTIMSTQTEGLKKVTEPLLVGKPANVYETFTVLAGQLLALKHPLAARYMRIGSSAVSALTALKDYNDISDHHSFTAAIQDLQAEFQDITDAMFQLLATCAGPGIELTVRNGVVQFVRSDFTSNGR